MYHFNYLSLLLLLFLTSCANKTPIIAHSATILIKTPNMKFYDKGFIAKFENYTQIQIYSAGTIILALKLYDDKICESTFKCQDSNEFNKKYLSVKYEKNFLKKLFDTNKRKIIFKDKKNNILIKITKD